MGLNSTSGEIKDSDISGNVRNGNNKISHNISQTGVHGIPTDISNQDPSDKQTDLKHSNSQKVKLSLSIETATFYMVTYACCLLYLDFKLSKTLF